MSENWRTALIFIVGYVVTWPIGFVIGFALSGVFS